ncbi:hypothetical protein CHUAL_006674 [Chamberlinius hualienensis]
MNLMEILSRNRRTPLPKKLQSSSSKRLGSSEILESAAQTESENKQKAERRIGYSGTVVDGKSAYILKYNDGVPVYGAGEPYYYSYTHNFPIATDDFQSLVNSHNLPRKYKFSGGLDVTGLLE